MRLSCLSPCGLADERENGASTNNKFYLSIGEANCYRPTTLATVSPKSHSPPVRPSCLHRSTASASTAVLISTPPSQCGFLNFVLCGFSFIALRPLRGGTTTSASPRPKKRSTPALP